MRLFTAITLPEDLRTGIRRLIDALGVSGAPVKWVKPENVHLTLRFLGEVEENRINDIYEVTRLASKGIREFSLRVEHVGAFPTLKRPRVVWVGVQSSPVLSTLHSRLEEGFHAIGFASEKKPYTPHLTIGRVKGTRGLEPLTGGLAHASFPPFTFMVGNIKIIESVLKPQGPIYTTIGELPLETPA